MFTAAGAGIGNDDIGIGEGMIKVFPGREVAAEAPGHGLGAVRDGLVDPGRYDGLVQDVIHVLVFHRHIGVDGVRRDDDAARMHG